MCACGNHVSCNGVLNANQNVILKLILSSRLIKVITPMLIGRQLLTPSLSLLENLLQVIKLFLVIPSVY